MEYKKVTMRNIQDYLTDCMKKVCQELFEDFLPSNYLPLVQKNSIGDSEFTSPCATQIFNMCNKKPNWNYNSIEEVAETIIKNFKNEEGIISELKVIVQDALKKIDKKDKKTNVEKEIKEKKKKKEKQIPKNVYIG